ncbi:MAG: beta-lactamase family protein [Rickettsiaceae bacterium]|nr:beta-lactamase family protein [Rickettsiaceae bacterium]
MSSTKEYMIAMRNGSTFTAPLSWEKVVVNGHIQITAPEKDLTCYFLELPFTGLVESESAIESIVNTGWQLAQPGFNLKPLQKAHAPNTDAWEKIYQIVYETSASESRTVLAIVRVFNLQAYLCLIDAKTAGLSRRGSEFMIMFESWKPLGFPEIKLLPGNIKNWPADDTTNFENFFVNAMQQFKLSGAAVAIVKRDGTMVYSKGLGVKKLGATDLVTVDTPFMIGSITKPLTTLMMAKLVDKNILTWETPVTAILPDFKLADSEFTKKLQIRHTVSASTGMPRHDFEWVFKHKGVTPEDRLTQMQWMQPTTGFGETFQYSNFLVMAGGYAAARAYMPEGNLEDAYATAMQQLVFNPVGMSRTVLKSEDALRLGSALPHGTDFTGQPCILPIASEDCIYSIAPAGAVWSTVEDMAKYLVLEMNQGVLAGNRIVSEEVILERRKPGIRASAETSYGLGLGIYNQQGLNMIGHDGGTLGFASLLFFQPESGIGMVILTNSSNGHSFNNIIKQKFLELTFGAKVCSMEMLHSAIKISEESCKKQSETIAPDLKDIESVASILGSYYNTKLGHIKLYSVDSQYEMEFGGLKMQVGSKTEADGQKILVNTSPPVTGGLKFQIERDGSELVLDSGQEKYIFARV